MADKMTIHEFGRALLDAGDLDPVYAVLWHWRLRTEAPALFRRWLIGYWCFYHVGTASYMVTGDPDVYWDRMMTGALSPSNAEFPRSAERRHFRGANAVKSVEYLAGRGSGAIWDDLLQAGPTAREVCAAVQKWVGFGPWISFKVADMLERLDVRPVAFDLDTAMYEGSPREACDVLFEQMFPGKLATIHNASKPEVVKACVHHVLDGLKEYKAPPRADRPLSFQEAETVLCKWKSYLGGHYHIGEDVAAVRKGLLRFAGCRVSQDLIKAGKLGGLW